MKNLSRYLISSVVLIFSFALSTTTVFAGSLTINSAVDGGDPIGNIPDLSCSSSINIRYDAITFHVDTTGVYTLDIGLGTLTDSVMVLISPSFDTANPLANCIEVDDDGGSGLASRITRTLTANTTYIVLVDEFSGGTGTYSLNISGAGNIVLGAPPLPITPVVAEDGIPLPAFYDGRINDYDTAAPIAVFPHEINGEIGLIIYNTEGVELLVVGPDLISNASDNPDGNVEVASANGITLYRIAGEEHGYWQINAPQYNGKTYVMIFPELFHSGGYESFEIEG